MSSSIVPSSEPFDIYTPSVPEGASASSVSVESIVGHGALGSSDSSSCSVKVMDPLTAGEKIIEFFAKKVRMARALKEYRNILREKRIALAPEKAVYTVKTVPAAQVKELIESWQSQLEDLLKHRASQLEYNYDKIQSSRQIINALYNACGCKLSEDPEGRRAAKPFSFLVAIDSADRVQAIAYVKRAHKFNILPFDPDYKLQFLATAPSNLSLTFQKGCVRGAATALIEEVAFTCLRNSVSRKIKVIAFDGAASFYEKLGFTTPYRESGKYSLDKANLLAFLTKFAGAATPAD